MQTAAIASSRHPRGPVADPPEQQNGKPDQDSAERGRGGHAEPLDGRVADEWRQGPADTREKGVDGHVARGLLRR